jgi:hypothetical protein
MENITAKIMFDADIVCGNGFFHFSKVLQPQSVQKDVECTDSHKDAFGGKMLSDHLLFAVDCPLQR